MAKQARSMCFIAITFILLGLFTAIPFSQPFQARQDEPAPNMDRGRTAEISDGSYRRLAHPGEDTLIVFGRVRLEIPAGAVSEPVEISIEELEGIARLNPGMTNVTGGPAGYRFKPDGMKFAKPVKMTIPYDKRGLKDEADLANLYTYFYNEEEEYWERLERIAIDEENATVTSLTTHFTDIINSTLTLPESPTPLSFNPTSIKEIKAADPGTGINLLDPPQANNQGTAILSYPIEIPPGRNGMQPQIVLQYNSDGDNGWLGLGWDLPVQSVSVDTRWGVPRYDREKETETYLLDGMQLTPLAHRGEPQPRTAEKVFHTRVEGSFRRIIRHGTSPADYWWEVTDKKGTRYFYGGTPEDGLRGEAVLAAGEGGNIFKWALVQTRDANGNTIDYSYTRVHDDGIGDGGDGPQGVQLYLETIRYTGSAGAPGPYSVRFIRDKEGQEPRRPDVSIDCRAGFKVVTADLLRWIEVRLKDDLIRAYELIYQAGAFQKTLLEAVVQYDADGREFNRHTFTYYDEIRDGDDYQGFSPPVDWDAGYDNISLGLLGTVEATALGSSTSDTVGGHLYTGVNPAGWTKGGSAGFKSGYSNTTSRGVVALIDLDGDGLPDKVYEKNGSYYYRRNESGPGGGTVFGPPVPLPTLAGISAERSETVSAGAESYFGVSFMANKSTTFTRSSVYFSDVNGDGLPDLVSHGNVYYNHLENGVPTFTLNDSSKTPVPIGGGSVDAGGLAGDFTEEYERMLETFPLMDAVLCWEAPYDGRISIDAPVRLAQEDRQGYATAEGVRVAVQHNGSELWATRIEADDYSTYTPTGLTSLPVKKGDRIYFRVQSVFDGAYDKVEWDPEILYLDFPATQDANGLNPSRFKISEDLIYAGRGGEIEVPLEGTIHLRGDLEKKGITSDDIRLVVYHNGNIVIERSLGWDAVGRLTLADELKVKQSDKLRFYIEADSPIDWRQMEWSPEVYYTAVEGTNIPVVDQNGNPTISLRAIYDVDLYGENNLRAPQEAWEAPEDGTILVWPALSLLPSDSLNGQVIFTVKRPRERLAKTTITVVNGEIRSVPPLQLRVGKGERLFFDFTSRARDLVAHISQKRVMVYYLEKTTTPASWVADKDGELIASPELLLTEAAISDGINGRAIFRIKRGPTILGEIDVVIHNGLVQPVFPLEIEVVRGERLELAFEGLEEMEDYIVSQGALIGYRRDGVSAPNGLYGPAVPNLLPAAYRGWGYFAYNGNGDRASSPIDQDELVIGDDYDAANAKVYIMYPQPEKDRWGSEDEQCWVGRGEISSSRRGNDYIAMPGPGPAGGGRGIDRVSSATQTAVSAGFSFATVSTSEGTSSGELDFLDMNGDRYPDIVGAGRIQYTTMTGGLEERNRAVPGFSGNIRRNTNSATNGGVAGNPAVMIPNSRGDLIGSTLGVIRGLMSPLGVTLNLFGGGGSAADYDLADMNGDGLPDRVTQAGGEIIVALNLGYGFAPPESWGNGRISEGTSTNAPVELGLGLGFNIGDYSFAGGLSYSTNRSQEEKGLLDMNGDGLVDLVAKIGAELMVALNTGGGFAPASAWRGAPVDKHLSDTANINLGGGAYFTIPIWIPFTTAFVIINPGVDAGRSIGNRESAIMDVNGDGLADYVSSSDDGNLRVALNRTGLTNKLRSIARPLGARIELEYARDGNTYDLPYSKWVLSRTAIYDGQEGDGADTQVITYQYAGGRYDRLEREFYGYGIVKTEFRDPADGDRVYKTLTVTYRNDSYYTRGLVESESIHDGAGRPYIRTVNQYRLLDAETEREFFDVFPYNTAATVFPQLVRVEKHFYEGRDNPGVYTYSTFEYDQYGNVIRYFDAGDAGLDDDVEAVIEYHRDLDHYIVEKASSLKVYSNGLLMRHREGSYQVGTGNLLELRQFLENGQAQVTNLEYYPGGNLRKVTGPPNANGERYTVEFTYDDVVGIYITRIADSFGYSSGADYDFRFGVETSSTDINGHRMRREYDEFGRPVKIFSPYDQDIPAVAFEYYPEEAPARAVTRNKIYFDPADGETLDTVIFTDGLKRVIQTKKEGEVLPEGAAEPVYGMNVSGKVLFDAMGRIALQGQPVFAPGYSTDFYADIPLKNPTENRYDVLDRTIEVILPDASRISTAYSIEDGLFKTAVTDPEGKTRHNFQDVQGNTVRVEQFNRGKKITTAYEYNPLNEIVKIVDDQNNITVMTYDLLGRMTSIKTPDAGLVEYFYDPAGNLIRKVDGNLRAKGRAIEYRYEYNRLMMIDYPRSADVRYFYGRPGDAHNRAGRLYKVIDGSGVTESFYGKLGEEIKTVKVMNLPAPGPWPWVFVSEQGFDYLGRVQWMTYPDGEKLVYEYDRGGQVKSVYGMKYWDRFDYVKGIGYDEFGQRVYIKYGNEVETRYAYDPYRRWLAGLRTRNQCGEEFQDLKYAFDRAGNILAIENAAREIRQTFEYDDLYQLVKAEGVARDKGWTNRYMQTFTYDTIGNIIEKTSLNQIAPGNHRPKELNYEFDYVYESARPHAPSRIGEWLYFYDGNGNTVRKERRKDEWPHHHFPGCGRCDEYSWDEENRLIKAEVGGKTTYFLYDAAGERTVKRGPHGETVYVSEYFQLQNRQQATKHVFVGTTRIVSKLAHFHPLYNPYDSWYERWNTYTYHPDHLGSSNFITDPAGREFEHIEYTPYGETWIDEGKNRNVIGYRFTSKELDEETGLYYFGARYYDPLISRWISPDPAMASLNLYMYCINSPITYTDPSGLKEQKSVYLTIDDVPGKYISEILKVLKEEGVHATFFIVGKELKANPDLVFQIVAEGHKIGNHSYNHSLPFDNLSTQEVLDEVTKTEEAIKDALKAGKQKAIKDGKWNSLPKETCEYIDSVIANGTKLFRPPGGDIASEAAKTLSGLGFVIKEWDVDPFDWDLANKGGKPQELINRVMNGWVRWRNRVIPIPHRGVHNNAVILLHDNRLVANALGGLIKALKQAGYTNFKKLGE